MGSEKYLSNVTSIYALNIQKKEFPYKPDFDFKSEEKFDHILRFIFYGQRNGSKGKAARKIL